MPTRQRSILSLAVLITLGGSMQIQADVSFYGLGQLYDAKYESYASAVSADGSTVVGNAYGYEEGDYDRQAFRWTEAEGMTGMGFLGDDGDPGSRATAVSADGSVIVGKGSRLVPGQGEQGQAFRWTRADGMVDLGFLHTEYPYSGAKVVTPDGSTVFGYAAVGEVNDFAPFRWTAAQGMLPWADDRGGIQAASADGSVLVGYMPSITGDAPEPGRWTLETGWVSLGSIPPGADEQLSSATDVSADGSVVVGHFEFAWDEYHAFRWTETDGMVPLLDSSQAVESSAQGVSADGSTVVGWVELVDDGYHPFIWNASHGVRLLDDLLENEFSVDLAGWELGIATDVSDDGRVIVGYGPRGGHKEAWRAVVPEPSSLVLLSVGTAVLLASVCRKRRATRAFKIVP